MIIEHSCIVELFNASIHSADFKEARWRLTRKLSMESNAYPMTSLKTSLLGIINKASLLLPKSILRLIADTPGMLSLFEIISRGSVQQITTPEGFTLIVNPLFHSNLTQNKSLAQYEPKIRQAISKFTQPGMIAYDIGANVGVFSLLFSFLIKDTGKVYSFEPEINNTLCLEKTVLMNRIQNIVLKKIAVSDKDGEEKFDRRGGAFSGRLLTDTSSYNPTKNIQLIKTKSIDSLIFDKEILPPDVVKIDVEGNENVVISGMKNTLKKYNPVIICELHTHLGEKSREVLELLTSLQYHIVTIDEALNENNSTGCQLDPKNPSGHIIAYKKIT